MMNQAPSSQTGTPDRFDVGTGRPLVCLHGSLFDYRVWTPIVGLLSERRRVIAPSLRGCFPQTRLTDLATFSIDQHVADAISLIEDLQTGNVDLLGHSRGGYVAFRVAQRRPDLVRKLVLAEPGGEYRDSDHSDAAGVDENGPLHVAARMIEAGEIDPGLAHFVNSLDEGSWSRLPEPGRQLLRDNAHTLIAQAQEKRPPISHLDAGQVETATLLITGSRSPLPYKRVVEQLGRDLPQAKIEVIPEAGHVMFVQRPLEFAVTIDQFVP